MPMYSILHVYDPLGRVGRVSMGEESFLTYQGWSVAGAKCVYFPRTFP